MTPLLWPSALCLSRSPDAQLESLGSTLLGAGFLYCILSASSLDPNSSGLPEGPFGRVWLSLPLLSITPSPTLLDSTGTRLPSWLCYIIVQRPLDLWNRMLNRHQAEITVMQFTGNSLLMHQFMSVQWEFFSLSHFISQFPPTQFPLITAMCHLLPVHHLGMAFLAGSKGQNITWWWCYEKCWNVLSPTTFSTDIILLIIWNKFKNNYKDSKNCLLTVLKELSF